MCSIFESYATDSQAGANSTVANLEKDRRFVVAVKGNVHYLYVAEVAIIEINEIASAESLRCLYSEIIAVQRHASRNYKGSVDLDIIEKINRVACLCKSQSLGKRIIGNAIYRGNSIANVRYRFAINCAVDNGYIIAARQTNIGADNCNTIFFSSGADSAGYLAVINENATSGSLVDDIAVNSCTVKIQSSVSAVLSAGIFKIGYLNNIALNLTSGYIDGDTERIIPHGSIAHVFIRNNDGRLRSVAGSSVFNHCGSGDIDINVSDIPAAGLAYNYRTIGAAAAACNQVGIIGQSHAGNSSACNV